MSRIAGMVVTGVGLIVFARPVLGQTVFPTGTTIYDPAEAYSSYILISDHSATGNHPSARVRAEAAGEVPGDVRLIDMNGNVVHTWEVAPFFNKRSRLLPNGNLVYVGPNRTIIEYDWDGNVVWTHQGIGSVNDLRVLPNNNRLLIAHEPIPEEFQRQVQDVEIAPWWGPRLRGTGETQLGADLYEVNLDGEVVWEWHAHEHLDLNRFSPATPEGDWLHVNSVAPVPENKWYDSGDERFRPGNIILNARNIDMVYIIDKQTKEIVWEGTHDYKGGMAHAHEAEMIEKGLPGAGNIILFDNGLFTRHRTHTGQTFIVEMDPITKEIVWLYETEGYANLKFFSKSMGTQKRLPNGNTFIAEDNTGRLFQVRPDGEIVWEYVNRGGTTRPSVIPYDFTPQLRAMSQPEERPVTPPNNLEWHLEPDGGVATPVDGPLMNVGLPALGADQEMLVVEVSMEPGQASSPHRHNAHVFVYVLEGAVIMQVEGRDPVTLHPGQMFHESPDDVHVVSRNASDSAPARFLAHIIKTVGEPVSTPVGGGW